MFKAPIFLSFCDARVADFSSSFVEKGGAESDGFGDFEGLFIKWGVEGGLLAVESIADLQVRSGSAHGDSDGLAKKSVFHGSRKFKGYGADDGESAGVLLSHAVLDEAFLDDIIGSPGAFVSFWGAREVAVGEGDLIHFPHGAAVAEDLVFCGENIAVAGEDAELGERWHVPRDGDGGVTEILGFFGATFEGEPSVEDDVFGEFAVEGDADGATVPHDGFFAVFLDDFRHVLAVGEPESVFTGEVVLLHVFFHVFVGEVKGGLHFVSTDMEIG